MGQEAIGTIGYYVSVSQGLCFFGAMLPVSSRTIVEAPTFAAVRTDSHVLHTFSKNLLGTIFTRPKTPPSHVT